MKFGIILRNLSNEVKGKGTRHFSKEPSVPLKLKRIGDTPKLRFVSEKFSDFQRVHLANECLVKQMGHPCRKSVIQHNILAQMIRKYSGWIR